jgi:hypothetical protein
MEIVTLLLERGADAEAKTMVSYADREIPSYPIHTHPCPAL